MRRSIVAIDQPPVVPLLPVAPVLPLAPVLPEAPVLPYARYYRRPRCSQSSRCRCCAEYLGDLKGDYGRRQVARA